MALARTKLGAMQLTKWLDGEKGRTAALASHIGVSPSAVSQWRSNGVPVVHMKAVRDFTRGAVTIEEVVRESARITAAKLAAKAAKAVAA